MAQLCLWSLRRRSSPPSLPSPPPPSSSSSFSSSSSSSPTSSSSVRCLSSLRRRVIGPLAPSRSRGCCSHASGWSGSRRCSTSRSCCSSVFLDHLRVPADLGVYKTTPSVGGKAAWRVRGHFDARVQESLLFFDPAQTGVTVGSCCSVASICCRLQFAQAARPLVTEALAEVLEGRVTSDLKTSQICGSCGTMFLKPSRFEF